MNALTSSVLDDSTVDVLRGWYDGTAGLEGLDVDTDLRWRLLQALVAHGKADLPEITAEEERDPTSTGHRRAQSTRALRPTTAAKDEAWDRAVNDDDLPNAVSEAIIAGISHPGQKELLAPYVERYFRDVKSVWDRRTSEARAVDGRGHVPGVVDHEVHCGGCRRVAGRRAPAGPAPSGVRRPCGHRARPCGTGVRPLLTLHS